MNLTDSHHINEISNALDFYYFLLRIDSAEILSLVNPNSTSQLKFKKRGQNRQNIIVKSCHQPEKKKLLKNHGKN